MRIYTAYKQFDHISTPLT